jgi:hypothetical protein
MDFKLGDRVKIQMSGDEEYYTGIIIDSGKTWVELEDYPEGQHIADETNIVSIELIKEY